MPATTDRSERGTTSGVTWRRAVWFLGLWAASLAVTVTLAYGLRALLRLGGLAG
jgi:hypothetical protein